MNMQIGKGFWAILALLTIAGSSRASAEVLFDNGAPVSGSFVEDADSGDPFQLTMAGTVFTPLAGKASMLTFAGSYLGAQVPTLGTDNFQISIYLASNGAPVGNPVTTGLNLISRSQIDGFATNHGKPIFSFTGALDTPYIFAASTSYYLGISDVGDGEDFGVTFTDNPNASTDEQSYYSGTGDDPNPYGYSPGFNSFSDPLSFSVSTPEPRVWSLGTLGILALIFAARRRTQNLRV